jgi:hypothetical protein
LTEDIELQTDHTTQGEREAKPDVGADSLHESLSKTYDAIQARDDKEAKFDPEMPPLHGEHSVEDTMNALAEWTDKPLAERKELAAAHAELEGRRAEAKRLGLTLEQAEAMKQSAMLQDQAAQSAKAAQLPHQLSEAVAAIQEMYPAQDPAEVSRNYVAIDKFIKADPVAGIEWLAEQFGINTPQLVAELTQRSELGAVTAAVDAFYRSNPDAANLENDALAILNSGDFRRSGNTAADLARVFELAKGRRAKPRKGGRASLETRMRQVYEEHAG